MDEITGMVAEGKAAAEALMTDTCVIERLTTGSDDDGFTVTTRETVWSGPCKLQTFEPYERTALVGEGTRIVQRYTLHVPVAATDIEVGDVATISSGRVFRVAGLNEKTHRTAQRLLADEQTGGIQ